MQSMMTYEILVNTRQRWGQDLIVGVCLLVAAFLAYTLGFSYLSILIAFMGMAHTYGAAKRSCEIIVPATFWFCFSQVLPTLLLNDREIDRLYFMPEGSMADTSAFVGCLLLFGSLLINSMFRRQNSLQLDIQGRYLASLSSKTLFLLYVAFSLVETLGLQYFVGALVQQMLAILKLRYVFAACLLYRAIKGEPPHFLLAMVGVEVLRIPFSIYATFKDLFLVLGVTALFLVKRLSAKTIFYSLLVSLLLLFYGVVWTVVKVEHRARINDAEASGATYSAVQKGVDLFVDASRLNGDDISVGFNALMSRLSYTTFTAYTMSVIPSQKPFFNGELLVDALGGLVPRVLYADKKIQDDSETINKVTGLGVSGRESSTSISLGFVGETYADFGYYYCFVFILLYILILKFIWSVVSSFAGENKSILILLPLVVNIKLELTLSKMLASTINYTLVVLFLLFLLNAISRDFRAFR